MAGEEIEGKILGLDSVIDMFRGAALMLIFLSGRLEMTTDEKKQRCSRSILKKTRHTCPTICSKRFPKKFIGNTTIIRHD